MTGLRDAAGPHPRLPTNATPKLRQARRVAEALRCGFELPIGRIPVLHAP